MLDDATKDATVFNFDAATATIKGARDYQEDALLSSFPLGQNAGFAIVADGMGGNVAGHVASTIVATECFCGLKKIEPELEDGTADIPLVLRQLAETANSKIRTRAETDDETYGMGSTLLAPVIRNNLLYWISIGDSPLLLFRNGALRQLNQDHSMAAQIDMMAKIGGMSAEAAAAHPDRSTLTSVLNGAEIPEIDCPSAPISLQENDIIIACSDGLQSLSNATIANTLNLAKSGRAIDIANAFLAALAVRAHEQQDNTAIVIIKLGVKSAAAAAVNAEDMPILAVAEEPAQETASEPVKTEEPQPQKDARKVYWYRGQKYYKD